LRTKQCGPVRKENKIYPARGRGTQTDGKENISSGRIRTGTIQGWQKDKGEEINQIDYPGVESVHQVL